MLINAPMPYKLIMFLVPYAIVGYDVIIEAAKNLFAGGVLAEHFLMSSATEIGRAHV